MDDVVVLSALEVLFKKLHPHLEDAAHALHQQANYKTLNAMHQKLFRCRTQVADALEAMADAQSREGNPDLAESLAEMAGNLIPVGEPYQQSLVLSQLCLEQALDEWRPLLQQTPDPVALPWFKRLLSFQALLSDPALGAEQRWHGIDPDIGEDELE